jgi:replicative DNA helicase
MIGDGSYLSNAPMRYTTASEDNSRVVREAAESEFGAKVTRYEGRGNWHQLLLSGNGNRWHPAGVNAWLRELGIFGQRSHEKRVPDDVFRLSNEQVAVFLRHLRATDGCIWVRPANSRGSSRVYFASCSRGLAEDVAALLLRMGIVSRIASTALGRHAPVFTVDVSGAEAQTRFLEAVGSFGPRREPARVLAALLAGIRPNPNVDTLPREVFSVVRASMAHRGVSDRAMATLRGTTYGGASHYAFSPSRATVASYARLLDDTRLLRHATNDLFWDRVVEIAPDGEDEVFDLTVPGPASWLADAIITHNSGAIEQDSDIVMFIHREDSDDPTVKGKADLIVAKHRNGPTASIPLTFLPHLTLFRNFART